MDDFLPNFHRAQWMFLRMEEISQLQIEKEK